MFYSQNDVKKLGSILGIWAHPDDESWATAGLMKMAVLNGQKVGIITATKGDAGETADDEKWPKNNLAEIRENELKECLCFVGKVEQFWLDYEDGKLADADIEGALEKLVSILKVFKPNSVVTFEPNGITGHDDHKTISEWTKLAVQKSGIDCRVLHAFESSEKFKQVGKYLDQEYNIFFSTDKPVLILEKDADVLLKLPENILECKLCCLQAHASQTNKLFINEKSKEALKVMAATECFVIKSGK